MSSTCSTAVRNGERTRLSRSRIASRCAAGSSAASSSLLYATSTPPSIGRLPQSPDGRKAVLEALGVRHRAARECSAS